MGPTLDHADRCALVAQAVRPTTGARRPLLGTWALLALLAAAATALGSLGGGAGAVQSDAVHAVPTERPTQGMAAAPVVNQYIAVPSYFWPGSAWDQVIASTTATTFSVMNVDSGPSNAKEPAFADVITRANNAGQKTMGYVDTNYGSRPIADVKADIAKYFGWYNAEGLGGIFLDRVPNTCDQVDYYRQLNAEVHARPGAKLLVLNPGANVPECYSDAGDVIVNFEGTTTMYAAWAPSAWTMTQPASRFWHIVYDTPLAQHAATVQLSKTRNAGYVYVTDDWFPNPYDNLPSADGWNKLIAAVRGTAPTSTTASTSPVTTVTTPLPPTTQPPATPPVATSASIPTATVPTPKAATQEAGMGFTPLSPERILDTRSPLGGRQGVLGPSQELTLVVRGKAGISSTAKAVMVTITAVDASAPTYLTAWPSGEARPNASVLNPMPDRPSSTQITAKVGADGAVRFYNAAGTVHLLVDVAGSFE